MGVRRPRGAARGGGALIAAVLAAVVTAGPATACPFALPPGKAVPVGGGGLPYEPGSSGDRDRSATEEEALALLEAAEAAARKTPYEGVQFVSSWGRGGARTVLVEVRHAPSYGTVVAVVGTPADPGSTMYARNDLATRSARLRGMSGTVLRLLGRNYLVAPVGEGSAAGRSSTVVEARRDDGSVAARFWVDRESGLLLRRQMFDEQGRVVRANAFIDLRLTRPRFTGHLPPAAPRPWEELLSRGDIADLRARGWTIPEQLPGGLVLVEGRTTVARNSPVLHLGYSDGLSMISLFVQRGKLDTAKFRAWQRAEFAGKPVYVRGGVQQQVVWAGPRHVYTVVADAPPSTVREAVTALPHQDRPGFWGRVLRGLERIGAWLNPFG